MKFGDWKKRLYYFLIENKDAGKGFIIQFRARAKEEKFIYGVSPIILPLLTLPIGLIFIYGGLPGNLKSPAVFFAVILAFTPFYFRLWLESKTFMEWTLGVGIYAICYLVSIGFIFSYLLFVEYIWIFYLISVIGLFLAEECGNIMQLVSLINFLIFSLKC